MRFWRYLLGVVVLCLVLNGCQQNPGPTPSPTPSPTPVETRISLRREGVARTVVNSLLFQANSPSLIRLTLTEFKATIFYVEDGKATALSWENGKTQAFDTDMEFLNQAPFNSRNFAFDDLDRIFTQAAELSGSSSGQELQINEVNDTNILMSVSTTPESISVFFRADGSLIRPLDFTVETDFAEGLLDVTQGREYITAITYSPNSGLSAEMLHEPGVVTTWNRPAKLPAFSSKRAVLVDPTPFQASLVQPDVIVHLMETLPNRFGKPAGTPISFEIAHDSVSGEPRITFDVDGNKVVTDLKGYVLPAS